MSLSIHKGRGSKSRTLPFKSWLYPDGTAGVRLDANQVGWLLEQAPYSTILSRVQNSLDVMELLLVTDALRRLDPNTPIRLSLPAFPYAQQDRACNPGEALSVRVMANLINSQGYERVTVIDPHSDVLGAVLDRAHLISQTQVIQQFDRLAQYVRAHNVLFVAPDSGALKKVVETVRYFEHDSFIRADKKRDVMTGQIVETMVHATEAELKGRTCLILDDVIVGGRTFIELARALKQRGAARVGLYCTHGVFAQGTRPLYEEGGIDDLFCTNSCWAVQPAGLDRVEVLKLEEVLNLL